MIMNIGEAARLSGLSARMIRDYEQTGLLGPVLRSPAGYRQYRQQDVDQLVFIHQARGLGFSLAQIADLLALRQDPQRASREVKALAEQQLLQLEARMNDLARMQTILKDLIAACPGDDGPHCTILNTLAEAEPNRSL